MLAEPKSRRGSPEGLGPYGLGLPGGPGARSAGAQLAPQGLLAAGAMLSPGAGYAGPAGGASLLGSLAAPGLMGQG